MNYESSRRLINLRSQSSQLFPSPHNFYKFGTRVLRWDGHTSCSGVVSITLYTSYSTFMLSVGSIFYVDDVLAQRYAGICFVYSGTQYNLSNGIITNVIPCGYY